MQPSIRSNPILEALENFHAKLVWGQLSGSFLSISDVLVNVYCKPSLTSGVEKNHRSGKQVVTQLRGHLNDFNAQKEASFLSMAHS